MRIKRDLLKASIFDPHSLKKYCLIDWIQSSTLLNSIKLLFLTFVVHEWEWNSTRDDCYQVESEDSDCQAQWLDQHHFLIECIVYLDLLIMFVAEHILFLHDQFWLSKEVQCINAYFILLTVDFKRCLNLTKKSKINIIQNMFSKLCSSFVYIQEFSASFEVCPEVVNATFYKFA